MNLVKLNNPNYNHPAGKLFMEDMFNNFFRDEFHDDFMKGFKPIPHSPRSHMIPTNVLENDKEFKLEVLLPGFSKEDLEINAQNKVLTIKVEKEEKSEENAKNEYKVHRCEFKTVNFEKQFRLPKSVDTEKISAKFEKGVLSVELPKKEEAKEKTPIEIEIS